MENKPLAERMRPHTLDDYVGQQHLVGPGKVLRKMVDTGVVSSFIRTLRPKKGRGENPQFPRAEVTSRFPFPSNRPCGPAFLPKASPNALYLFPGRRRRRESTPNPWLFRIFRFSDLRQVCHKA